eukprot:5113378-Pyramimonas_sp.AAC.1
MESGPRVDGPTAQGERAAAMQRVTMLTATAVELYWLDKKDMQQAVKNSAQVMEQRRASMAGVEMTKAAVQATREFIRSVRFSASSF